MYFKSKMFVEDTRIIKRFYISGNPILNKGDRFIGKKQSLKIFIKLGESAKKVIPNYKFLHLFK